MYVETGGSNAEYENFKYAGNLLWSSEKQDYRTGLFQRELAGLGFLATFAREVGASLNPRGVVLAAAKLLYNYFQYGFAVFSLPADSGGLAAYSPLDAADRVRCFLMARKSFPELKEHEIVEYDPLDLAAPGLAGVSCDYPTVVEIIGDGIKIALYCEEDAAERATSQILNGVVESLTAALKNAREYERVKELSVLDDLTGLYNRRVLEEFLSVEERRRNPAPLAILILQADDFKSINDAFGHAAGDRVLSALGKLLQENCRKENIVARYGNEEFAVLITNAGLTATAALQTAERLRNALSSQDFIFSGRKVKFTVSIGVAYSSGNEAVSERLLARADQALYQAKKSGKNRICCHEATNIEKIPMIRSELHKLLTTLQIGEATSGIPHQRWEL